jgi:hypothetical protein
MTKLEMNLSESETKIVLEALSKRAAEMAEICRLSKDEDIVADTGNELIELRLLLMSLSARAVAMFGDSVTNCSRDEL